MEAGPKVGGGVAGFMVMVTWLWNMYTVDICGILLLKANTLVIGKRFSDTTWR